MMSLAPRRNDDETFVSLFDSDTPKVRDEAEENLLKFLGPPKKDQTKSKTISDSQFARAMSEMNSMRCSGDWTLAGPRHFLALYVYCFTSIYGFEPTELTPIVRLRAAGAAGRMLKTHFDNDSAEMANFIRWTWKGEQLTEKWRRENPSHSGGVINWNWQFSGRLLDKYRGHVMRLKGSR